MSAPQPPNPFEPVPKDTPEDWREGDEDEEYCDDCGMPACSCYDHSECYKY